MKFYTVDIYTGKASKVANTLDEFIEFVNNDRLDTENNWIASERSLDKVISDKPPMLRGATLKL